MSVDIINTFTSSDNIKYLRNFLQENIKNERAKEAILDRLTESIFEFPSHALIDDSGRQLRKSTDTWSEVRMLNRKFIEDRVSFANGFDTIATESYHMNQFISDSLNLYGYENLNTLQSDNSVAADRYDTCNSDQRLFRYQDPYDIRRSNIPRWQINKRGTVETSDELRDSEGYKLEKSGTMQHCINNIDNIDSNCKRPQWFDI